MEPHNLVSSLEYLVSNRRQVLLGGIRLGGSVIGVALEEAERGRAPMMLPLDSDLPRFRHPAPPFRISYFLPYVL